ncbi:MAG: hypothetical protein ACPGUD_05690 [Parashewanella sp.]
MLKYLKLFGLTLLLLQSASATASQTSDNADLTTKLNLVKGSISMIHLDHVHRDYIHQIMYLDDLLNAMIINLDNNTSIFQVQSIAEDLNQIGNNTSVGENLLSLPYEQESYYTAPIDSTPHILGRKAVGTGMFEQYTLNILNTLEQKLIALNLGSVEQFIDSNALAYKELDGMTQQYYQQANKQQKIGMNFGFDYEKVILARFNQPLKKFYQ